MINNNKKDLILAVSGVLLLIGAVIGVSYAVFTFSSIGKIENTITSGTITFSYNETSNGISITNAMPMSDATGKLILQSDTANGINRGYFDFNVAGSLSGTGTVTYEVYGTVDSSSTMDPNYIKVYLTDGTINENPLSGYDGSVVPIYNNLPTSSYNSNGKRLFTETFTGTGKTRNFRLRLWVADNYTVNDASKTFIMRVNVAAIA